MSLLRSATKCNATASRNPRDRYVAKCEHCQYFELRRFPLDFRFDGPVRPMYSMVWDLLRCSDCIHNAWEDGPEYSCEQCGCSYRNIHMWTLVQGLRKCHYCVFEQFYWRNREQWKHEKLLAVMVKKYGEAKALAKTDSQKEIRAAVRCFLVKSGPPNAIYLNELDIPVGESGVEFSSVRLAVKIYPDSVVVSSSRFSVNFEMPKGYQPQIAQVRASSSKAPWIAQHRVLAPTQTTVESTSNLIWKPHFR